MPEQSSVFFLRDGNVSLRPSNKADAPDLVRWFNDPEVTRFTGTRFPLYESQEEEFIAKKPSEQPSKIHLLIEVDGKPIGVISLFDIDYISRTAQTGTVIGEKDSWSKGYGTRAKILILRFAFDQLNLRKVYSRVIAFNGRSLRYAEKCGYEREAVLKQDRYRDGEYHDLVILSVWRENFMAKFPTPQT